jgi:hypothetical protein
MHIIARASIALGKQLVERSLHIQHDMLKIGRCSSCRNVAHLTGIRAMTVRRKGVGDRRTTIVPPTVTIHACMGMQTT